MRWVWRIVVVALVGLGIEQGGLVAARNLSPHIVSSAITRRPIVALTFDDGPSPFTPQILAVLHAFHVHATFFLVGLHIKPYAAFVRAEVAAGNQLGNHTYTHADLPLFPTSYVISQLTQTQAAAQEAAGVTPHWFRPPYGAVDARIVRIAASLGLRTILWSVDPADWARPGVSVIVARVLEHVQPGSVILLHDGGGDRGETVMALRTILEVLMRRGYHFDTLDQLFNRGRAVSAR
jgi:peptidoglycan/xylan/chitin deacetylase (PgdA/CDA1 family)